MLIQSKRCDEIEAVADGEADGPNDQGSPEIERAEPSPQPAPPRVRDLRSMRWLSTHLRSALVALLVLALACGLGYTTLRLRHQDVVSHARGTALTAAQTYAVDMATYDYRHLDADFGKVKQHSSASFQAKFTQSSNDLKNLLTKFNATASARVLAAGLVSADTSRAVAIVFLTQTVTNTAQKTKPPDTQSRIRMTLTRNHGQWFIDNVELL